MVNSKLLVLGVAKLSKRISCTTTISNKNVQVAVLTKQQLSSIMIGRWLHHLKDGSVAKNY